MTHTLPQILPECEALARQFCATCRKRDAGAVFRETILAIRSVSGVAVDFDCPRGLAWDFDAQPPDHATINAHLATCQSCPHAGAVTTTKRGRDVWTIKCGSKRKGCGTVQLRHAGRCPEGRW